MVAVHALVAEVLAYFIYTLKSAYYQALQVKLRGDAHVHVGVECVEVRYERPCARSAGYCLQRRRFNLGVSGLVEHFPYSPYHRGALKESVLHAIVNNEVYVPLAVAQLWVVKLVVSHAVLIFHYRQGFEALREQRQVLRVYADFASLRAEHEAFYADEVAYVKQFLEHLII